MESQPKARFIRITRTGGQLLHGMRGRFPQGSSGFKANAINKTLGRFARRLLETSMQRSVRCAKRVSKVLRSQGLFASLPHDILRLQQERIGRRQMVLRNVNGLPRWNRVDKCKAGGGLCSVGAANLPYHIQGQIDPRQ